MSHLECSKVISAPSQDVFSYLCDPIHLPKLLKQDLSVECINVEADLAVGSEYSFQMTRYGVTQEVRFEVTDVIKNTRLIYKQTEGLFHKWKHTLKFEPHDNESTLVTDVVEYSLPFGVLGLMADDLYFRFDLKEILSNRLSEADRFFKLRKDQ